MKFATSLIGLVAIAQSASAHCESQYLVLSILSPNTRFKDIFNTLIYGNNQSSTAAVREAQNNSPVQPVTSLNMRCNVDPYPATATVNVSAGDTIGFTLSASIFHEGPAAIYLGKAPELAADWDGSGANWFKIAEWGAEYNPWGFTDLGMSELTTTIPKDTPSGQYLVRGEQIALHVQPAEYYLGCAQINIVNGGSGNPRKTLALISTSTTVFTPTTPTLDLRSGADLSQQLPWMQ
ncbi:hypothetical protein C0991_001417 [Blastosporella zonata]|nr:hypothetical protein C0991_001417 [Blastosporella zonata]